MKSIVGAWRGLSLLKQADISTAQAVNTSFYFSGDPLEPEPDTLFVGADEVNGELLPTTHRLLTRKLAGKHKSKAFPHLVGLFASMVMGKDTPSVVGTTTAYKHKIEIDKTVVELPYRCLIEHDGDTQKLFTGVACLGFQLSGQRGQFVEFEADLLGSGIEAADATVKPARVAESYLAYGDVKFTKGGAFDGTTITGGTDLSGKLIDFTIGVKNNGKGVHLMGDPSGNYGRIQRGPRFDIDFKAKFELEDQSHRTDLLAETEMVASVPIVGGTANGDAKYTVEAIFPRVIYKAAKKGVDDGNLVVAAEFQVLADPTYGPLILNVINLQQASYLAAA
ncbi:MAG: phage tail tube protein [Bryobacteraceae bacterium]